LGGIISPLVSGHLIGIGLPYSEVSLVMSSGSALAALALLLSVVWLNPPRVASSPAAPAAKVPP